MRETMSIAAGKIFFNNLIRGLGSSVDERSHKAKRHIFLSVFYKVVDTFFALALVPLSLNYLDSESYGIWLVLFSITSWLQFLNVGLGQGLRNKLAKALAKGNHEEARQYISTAYAAMTAISSAAMLVFFGANHFIDWSRVLNTTQIPGGELKLLAAVAVGGCLASMVLSLITTILTADQRPSINTSYVLFSKILSTIGLLILLKTTEGSLLKLGCIFSLAPVLVLVWQTVHYFSRDYRRYRPAVSQIRIRRLGGLLTLGTNFFIISIAYIILFTTGNFIIAQLYGPAEVTPYQIAAKYFGMAQMLFMIVLQPLWSAVTDAYHKEDFRWIERIMKKMFMLWRLFIAGVVAMLIISPVFYKYWLHGKVTVPFWTSVGWAAFVAISGITSVYTSFINGVGKLRLQVYTAVFGGIVSIPLALFFAKTMNMGIAGVIFAAALCQGASLLWQPVQYRKIIAGTARGIWNK